MNAKTQKREGKKRKEIILIIRISLRFFPLRH